MRNEQGYRYTPRGTTWKPCPACGKEPKSSYPTNGICHECAQVFEWAKGERERFSHLKDMVIRTVPTRPQDIDLPYSVGHGHDMPSQKEYAEARDQLAHAMIAIVESLLLATGGAAEIIRHWAVERREPGWGNHSTMPPSRDGGWGNGHRHVLVRKEHAAAFDSLNELLHVMVTCAHESGVHDGKSLLTQLASGKITNDEFNEVDVNLARRVREKVEHARMMMNKEN